MNKDLIIKLAKLANNNPNEHEANAAARKVCQLLAEANFKFDDTPTVDYSKLGWNPSKAQQDWVKYTGSVYPPFSDPPKSQGPPPFNPVYDFYDDFSDKRFQDIMDYIMGRKK